MIGSSIIRRVFKDSFINSIKSIYKRDLKEENLIRSLPRFSKYHAKLDRFKVFFPDSESFLSMREEIWNKESYFFKSEEEVPYIIDCGSNIGLSVLYFKLLFPASKILAFEPDPVLLHFLNQNLKSNSINNVEVVPKAVWNSNEKLFFLADGADGGKISPTPTSQSVEAVSLVPFLERKVDLLKIDIEGNELEVLRSCKDKLYNVQKLFIEYHSFKNKLQQLSKILKILEEGGFRYFLESATPRRMPFSFASNQEMDLQVNIHAWQN